MKILSIFLIFIAGCIPLSQLFDKEDSGNTIGKNIDKIIENPPSNRTEWFIAAMLLAASIAGYCTKRYIDNYHKNKKPEIVSAGMQVSSFLEPRRQAEITNMRDHLDNRFDQLDEKISGMKIIFGNPNGIPPEAEKRIDLAEKDSSQVDLAKEQDGKN
jgi:hypothetical protein